MSNAREVAERYFQLSNEGRLDDIEAMFTPTSTYSSAHTGIYLGTEDIMAMQRKFYASFETMGWDIHAVDEVKPGIVWFDFTFTGRTHEGEAVIRPGVEYVVVVDGRLRHVEVRSK